MSKWRPRAQILSKPEVTRQAFSVYLMSDEIKKQTLTPPAINAGIDFLRLENDDNAYLDFDGTPWMPRKIRASAMMLQYYIEWVHTNEASWRHTAQDEEKVWREILIKDYEGRLKELRPQLKDAKGEDLKLLQEDIREFENLIRQLRPTGIGFLRASHGAMGTKVDGVFWGLAAPNVPVKFESAFLLPRDRSLSFRLLRYKAPRDQAKFEWKIELEGGTTCYALIFGDDGNSATFVHYRSMTPQQRQQKLAAYNKLLDNGRVTASDQKKIIDYEDQIRKIKLAAGERTTDKGLTTNEKARVKDLKDKIAVFNKKKLTPAQETQRQKMSNDLYLSNQQFFLQENANELLGKPIDVTVQFLRAGYVVVRCGTTNFVYENCRVTGAEPHEFHFGLPDKSIAKITSDGGKWSLVWGRPKWGGVGGTGLVRTVPFEWGEPLDIDKYVQALVGDQTGDANTEINLLELRKPEIKNGNHQNGLYQLEIKMTGGDHTPELYSLGLHSPAEIDETTIEPLWDSLTEVISPLRDVVLQDDRRRARHAQVILARPLIKLQTIPEAMMGMVCQVTLLDVENPGISVEYPFVTYGCIMKTQRARLGALNVGEFSAIDLAGGEMILDVVGCEGFLNREIKAFWQGDGLWPGEYIRILCQDALLPEALWNRIPLTEEEHKAYGWKRIPPTRPGRYPHFRPRPGMTFWSHIQATVNNHCPGGALWNDGLGLRLDMNIVRDKLDIDYGTPRTGTDVKSNRCIRNQEGFKLSQDIRDYTTKATFVGKKDPLTGIRFIGTESIPQAEDKRFKDSPFYLGYDIPYVSEPDDSMINDAQCIRAARDKLFITPLTPDGLAPWWNDLQVDLDPLMLTGDLFKVFGFKFLLDSIDIGALSGENAGKMQISLQLAEDTPIKKINF